MTEEDNNGKLLSKLVSNLSLSSLKRKMTNDLLKGVGYYYPKVIQMKDFAQRISGEKFFLSAGQIKRRIIFYYTNVLQLKKAVRQSISYLYPFIMNSIVKKY